MPTYHDQAFYNLPGFDKHSPRDAAIYNEFGGMIGARALAVTRLNDTIQIDDRLEEEYRYIAEHYEQAGLETADADNIIFGRGHETAQDFPNHKLSVYMFNILFHGIRPDEKRLQATEHFGNKNKFIEYLSEKAHPAPFTTILRAGETPNRTAIPLPAILKPAESSAGINIQHAKTLADVKKYVKAIGVDFQVQEELQEAAFLSSLFKVDEAGRVRHFATTEQVMKNNVHVGSRPTDFDPREKVLPVAKELGAAGLKDIFGLDFAVTAEGDVKLIECNPRTTAAVPPAEVAKKLKAKEWSAYMLPARADSVADLSLEDITYDQTSRAGVVLIDWGRISFGKQVGVFIAGPVEAQKEYLHKLSRVLKVSQRALAHC